MIDLMNGVTVRLPAGSDKSVESLLFAIPEPSAKARRVEKLKMISAQ